MRKLLDSLQNYQAAFLRFIRMMEPIVIKQLVAGSGIARAKFENDCVCTVMVFAALFLDMIGSSTHWPVAVWW